MKTETPWYQEYIDSKKRVEKERAEKIGQTITVTLEIPSHLEPRFDEIFSEYILCNLKLTDMAGHNRPGKPYTPAWDAMILDGDRLEISRS